MTAEKQELIEEINRKLRLCAKHERRQYDDRSASGEIITQYVFFYEDREEPRALRVREQSYKYGCAMEERNYWHEVAPETVPLKHLEKFNAMLEEKMQDILSPENALVTVQDLIDTLQKHYSPDTIVYHGDGVIMTTTH